MLSLETVQMATVVSTTGVGGFLLLRVALGALSLLLFLQERPRRRVMPWMSALLGIAVLGTFSLAGHNAASAGTVAWPALTDLIHLSATAIWYGGLCCLLLLPWSRLQAGEEEIRTAGRMVDRFSRMGLIAMAVLAMTGMILAVRQLYGLAALVEHPYGERLLVKLLFLAGVLALAGFNHLIAKPRLGKGGSEAGPIIRPFRWVVAGEVVLGLAVVSWAGLLSTTAPPQAEPFRVTVTMADGAVTPGSLELPVNRPIRMTVVNRGSAPQIWVAPKLPHEMEEHAHGAGMVGLIFYVEPGERLTQTFLLRQPGQHAIDCVESNGTPNCRPGVVTVR